MATGHGLTPLLQALFPFLFLFCLFSIILSFVGLSLTGKERGLVILCQRCGSRTISRYLVRTNAQCAPRRFIDWSTKRAISGRIPARSLTYAPFLAAKSAFPGPTNSLDMRGFIRRLASGEPTVEELITTCFMDVPTCPRHSTTTTVRNAFWRPTE